jgi:predicted nucleotidyltransferase
VRFGLQESIIKEIIAAARKYKTVQRVVLFGSRARGDYRDTSDIDLGLYMDGEVPVGHYLDLDEAAGIYKLDVADAGRPGNERLRQRITEQGVEIYRRKPKKGKGR